MVIGGPAANPSEVPAQRGARSPAITMVASAGGRVGELPARARRHVDRRHGRRALVVERRRGWSRPIRQRRGPRGSAVERQWPPILAEAVGTERRELERLIDPVEQARADALSQ